MCTSPAILPPVKAICSLLQSNAYLSSITIKPLFFAHQAPFVLSCAARARSRGSLRKAGLRGFFFLSRTDDMFTFSCV